MKQIKYNLITKVLTITEDSSYWEDAPGNAVVIKCADADLDAALVVARKEAYEEPIVEDIEEPAHEATTDDVLNALLGVSRYE